MLNQYDVFWDEDHNIYQVRTKTDVYALEFDSEDKKKLFERMVELISEKPDIKLNKLLSTLKGEYEEFMIMDILNELKEYGLLSMDYYVDLAIKNKEPNNHEDHKEKKILIIGEDAMMDLLKNAFSAEGFENVECINHKAYTEKENKVFLDNIDFCVVDGHNWNPVVLKSINKELIKRKKPWLYVKGLEGAEVKVGPIFLGGELGCYDCLRKRIQSNDELVPYNANYENYLIQNNKTGQPDKLPVYKSSLNILANIVVVEVSKYLEFWSVPETIGNYISLNMVTYQTASHTLLKIPYCESCKPEIEYNLAPWLESVTLT